MLKEQRLSGSTNWINWVSTLRLYFRIINIEKYFIKDEEYENAPEATRNLALLIIRQNLLAEPLSLVFDSTDPLEVLNTLSASYEGTGPVIRQELYMDFHTIKYEHYKSINEFISAFKTFTLKLSNVGAKIDDIN